MTILLGMFSLMLLADRSRLYYHQILLNVILILCMGIALFLTSNLFIFYVLFEVILIPFFLVIIMWGSRSERIEAAFRLLFYTFVFSLPILFSLIFILLQKGTLDLAAIETAEFTYLQEKILWLFLFFAFVVKAAIPPFHLWLVEAHVEAPTIGSVLLSGLALKLGLYGIFCIIWPLFYLGFSATAKYIQGISMLTLIYPVGVIFAQLDWKKIIAYFSVVHMALIFIGLFSNMLAGFQGAFMITIIHSFVSPALFACVGFVYDRYKTKDITGFGRLADIMPVFAILVFLLFLIEIAFPGTPNFIGELLIFNSTFISLAFGYFLLFPYYMFFAIFIFKIYGFIFFDYPNENIIYYADLNIIEFSSLIFIFAILLLITIYPQILLNIAALSFWLLTV